MKETKLASANWDDSINVHLRAFQSEGKSEFMLNN